MFPQFLITGQMNTERSLLLHPETRGGEDRTVSLLFLPSSDTRAINHFLVDQAKEIKVFKCCSNLKMLSNPL